MLVQIWGDAKSSLRAPHSGQTRFGPSCSQRVPGAKAAPAVMPSFSVRIGPVYLIRFRPRQPPSRHAPRPLPPIVMVSPPPTPRRRPPADIMTLSSMVAIRFSVVTARRCRIRPVEDVRRSSPMAADQASCSRTHVGRPSRSHVRQRGEYRRDCRDSSDYPKFRSSRSGVGPGRGDEWPARHDRRPARAAAAADHPDHAEQLRGAGWRWRERRRGRSCPGRCAWRLVGAGASSC